MPSRTSKKEAAAVLPNIPQELIDQLIVSPPRERPIA